MSSENRRLGSPVHHEPSRSRKQKPSKQNHPIRNEIISWIQILLAAMCIALVLNTCIIANSRVPSGSMENTIMTNDRVIGSRLSYKFSDPERGDIAIFRFPDDESIYYVKRIIGLPGETIQIDDEGNIYIDGEVLQEHYGLERIKNPGSAREPITLGEDEYFVLGDNRNNSEDSRFTQVGVIHRDDIVGRAWLRIYPFDRIGFIRHQ